MSSKSTVLAVAALVPLLLTVPAADAVADPAPCSMFCEGRPPSAKDCMMFCAEPVPPADARGCRLFCDLGTPQDQGVA